MTGPEKDRMELIEQEELAALAGLGLLPSMQAARVPKAEVARMSAAAALVGESVTPVAPSAGLKNRLMERVADYEMLKPLADVRSTDTPWLSVGSAPGVEFRTLFVDRKLGRSTYLVRMEPGAVLPPHTHGDDEQCLVLNGDIRWGNVVYEKGDFVVMASGSHHPAVHSVGGNLLLLISGHNEFVKK